MNNESAVSESVGVILIVAVTVILAAVIAAYAFGLVQDIHVERNLVLTATQLSPSEMIVTYRGGGSDSTLLTSIRIIWPSGTVQTITSPKVGDEYHATNAGSSINVTPGEDHVLVVGHFTDNKESVLLNAFI